MTQAESHSESQYESQAESEAESQDESLADAETPPEPLDPPAPAVRVSPDAVDAMEGYLLGGPARLTRVEVAAEVGVPLALAEELWHLLGFPHRSDDDVAFTDADVTALRLAKDLLDLGVLAPDSQSALVRTWGRSFARLAEWQVDLLAGLLADIDVARIGEAPAEVVTDLADLVVPRVEELQSYIWRRHLASAAGRRLDRQGEAADLVIGFIDIVGYTSTSKSLDEAQLVGWLEGFERTVTSLVTDNAGQIIKTIGDEVMFVADDPRAAARIALAVTDLPTGRPDPGSGEGLDVFPSVRVGLAHGEVVRRLGDVFGPTVNIAARLTGVARPGTVVVDQGFRDALGEPGPEDPRMRRLRRVSVKGYARLEAWVLRPPKAEPDES